MQVLSARKRLCRRKERCRLRVAAVICEYNPFHFGHKKQLEVLKTKYDAVVGIMSGDAVQRGEAAIADKYVRARAAVECGMDAVFSLPFPHCCASAADFARAGVYVADALGADALAFGVEDDFAQVERAAAVTGAPGFRETLDALIKRERNLSYPKAVSRLAGAEAASLLQKPNNILAVEYLHALRGLQSPLKPEPVARDGACASSSSLRTLLREAGRDAFLRALPEGSRRVYGELDGDVFPRDTERLSRALLLLLRGGKTALSQLYGTGGGLGGRMVRAAAEADSLASLVARCRAAGFTDARVRRAALAVLLDIRREAVHRKPAYTLLLAMNAAGRELLRTLRPALPVVTKPARAAEAGPEVKAAFAAEVRADALLALTAPKPQFGNSLRRSPFVRG